MLAFAAGAPAAHAVVLHGTALVDRPAGSGALPFDGIASSQTGSHALTPDGRYLVFNSDSDALLAGDEDTATNVYRVDLTTGALLQVDTTPSGGQPNPRSTSDNASISADGNEVGFMTTASTLAPSAGPDNQEFVVKNLTTGAVELATRATGSAGAPATGVESAVLSGDGRHVAFTAQAALQANNASGVAGTTDAYERSLDAGTTRMMSVTSAGAEGGGVVRRARYRLRGGCGRVHHERTARRDRHRHRR